jgi:hypothetical protein
VKRFLCLTDRFIKGKAIVLADRHGDFGSAIIIKSNFSQSPRKQGQKWSAGNIIEWYHSRPATFKEICLWVKYQLKNIA